MTEPDLIRSFIGLGLSFSLRSSGSVRSWLPDTAHRRWRKLGRFEEAGYFAENVTGGAQRPDGAIAPLDFGDAARAGLFLPPALHLGAQAVDYARSLFR